MPTQINEYNPQSVTPPYKSLVEKLNEFGMGNKELAIRAGSVIKEKIEASH